MTLPGYDRWLEPPALHELLDDADTQCLGFYPETEQDDAFDCESRTTCPLCGGVVCSEHDDTADCADGVAHESCHADGCNSYSCEQDRHDDYLLAQAGM